MTDITRCPECLTHFKITEEQRNAHHGLVRCGQCQTVFNAVENLYFPPQQLDLPLILDDIADVTSMHAVYDPYSAPDSSVTISPEAAARRSNDFSHLADIYVSPAARPYAPQKTWLWVLGSILLLILLLAQATYLLRVDIAARLPDAKPVLSSICSLLNCSISLPQKIDLLSIESSELEADPVLANIITLHALLRSRALYPVAYPNIELTLTDTQDNAVARRTYSPAEYLPQNIEAQTGFPANTESSINLHLNTTDLKPAGYRLFLFYPQ